MFEEILSRPSVNFPIAFSTYMFVFLESFFLGLLISWIYRRRGLSQDRGFQYSLWLIAPIVATLLLFIGSNLALSIGMVGSLSIIRFRTAIKDPVDLMYVFILIMVGLGSGTQNFVITALATVLFSLILFFLSGKKNQLAELDLLMLKDKDVNKIQEAMAYVKNQYPHSEVLHLNLADGSADATLHGQNFAEKMAVELKEKFSLQSIQLLKK